MTDETKPWRAECPSAFAVMRNEDVTWVCRRDATRDTLDRANAELDKLRARVAELEELWAHSIYKAADNEQMIDLLQNYVDNSDRDGWAPVSKEAMRGELVRVRFRDGLAIGEAVARYEIDHGEYGVVDWEGWVVPELDCGAEVIAYRPLATAKETV